MTNSKTYLLLNGAFHGGWVWDQVKKLLEIQDHTVYAPDLPGLGEDKTENYRRKAHTSEDNSINIDYDIARKVFFEYSTSEEAHLLYNKLVSHPIQTYEDKINAKEFLDSDVEKIYIYN